MAFPLQVGELTIPHAAGLGYVVAADLAAGGGTLIPDQTVNDWLPTAAADLDEEEQRALIRGLLRQRDPDAISAACAVARAVAPEGIGAWFLSALVEHDVGLLMAPDARGRSVEELLACTGAALCELDDPQRRSLVLDSLRSVAASADEARVLALYGTAAELREWGPPLLAGGNPSIREAFIGAREREAVESALGALLDG